MLVASSGGTEAEWGSGGGTQALTSVGNNWALKSFGYNLRTIGSLYRAYGVTQSYHILLTDQCYEENKSTQPNDEDTARSS